LRKGGAILFGVFIGLLVGAGLLWFVFWMRRAGIKLNWYEWLIGGLGLFLVFLSVWHYFGSLTEKYPHAGLIGLVALGIPGLILLAFDWRLASRGKKASV